jgi:hypothetical protein
MSDVLKDPNGGLTAKGCAFYLKKDGSHLRGGVKKSDSEMVPDDMRRKGSWAMRFYRRGGKLPPLLKNGKPTRFALTAAASGEQVPTTVAAAHVIAAKGK